MRDLLKLNIDSKLNSKIVLQLAIAIMGVFVSCEEFPNKKINLPPKIAIQMEDYMLKTNYKEGNFSYTELIISNSSRINILTGLKFDSTLAGLGNMVTPAYLSESKNFLYHVDANPTPSSYLIYAIEKEGNTMIIYKYEE